LHISKLVYYFASTTKQKPMQNLSTSIQEIRSAWSLQEFKKYLTELHNTHHYGNNTQVSYRVAERDLLGFIANFGTCDTDELINIIYK
jgi:hypothetical protein